MLPLTEGKKNQFPKISNPFNSKTQLFFHYLYNVTTQPKHLRFSGSSEQRSRDKRNPWGVNESVGQPEPLVDHTDVPQPTGSPADRATGRTPVKSTAASALPCPQVRVLFHPARSQTRHSTRHRTSGGSAHTGVSERRGNRLPVLDFWVKLRHQTLLPSSCIPAVPGQTSLSSSPPGSYCYCIPQSAYL